MQSNSTAHPISMNLNSPLKMGLCLNSKSQPVTIETTIFDAETLTNNSLQLCCDMTTSYYLANKHTSNYKYSFEEGLSVFRRKDLSEAKHDIVCLKFCSKLDDLEGG